MVLGGGPDLPLTKLRFKTKGQTATSGKDFAPTKGKITIEPGDDQVEIPVNVVADNKVEGDETFKVKLFKPKNLTLSDTVAKVTIADEDD